MSDRILFVDACFREGSRTRRLAEHLLGELSARCPSAVIDTFSLERERLLPLFADDLAKRGALQAAGRFDDPMFDAAKRLSAADILVIAAPYWDFSYPAALKAWIEHICAVGVTFDYSADGSCFSLCRARRLYYVVTCGGRIPEPDFGFDHLRALCARFFAVPEAVRFAAEDLDQPGTDVDAVLKEAESAISAAIRTVEA